MHKVTVKIEGPEGASTVEVETDGPNAAVGTAVDFLTGKTSTPVHRIKSLELVLEPS